MSYVDQRLDDETTSWLTELPLHTLMSSLAFQETYVPPWGHYSKKRDAYFLYCGSDHFFKEGKGGKSYYSLVMGSSVVAITAIPQYSKRADGTRLCTWEIDSIVVPADLESVPGLWDLIVEALIEAVRKVPHEADRFVAFSGNLGRVPVVAGEVY